MEEKQVLFVTRDQALLQLLVFDSPLTEQEERDARGWAKVSFPGCEINYAFLPLEVIDCLFWPLSEISQRYDDR